MHACRSTLEDPTSGYGTFRGTATPLDGRSGGALATSTLTQVSREGASGAYWEDRSRVAAGVPFALVLDDGEEIEVDAREPLLFGFSETTTPAYAPGRGERPRREIVAQLFPGDAIWATGVLARPPEQKGGAYRGNLARRALRPPRRGRVELSREPPFERWLARARAHKRGGYAALVAVAALHAIFFRGVDADIWAWRTSASWSAWDYTHTTFMQIPRLGFASVVAFALVAFVWLRGVRRAEQTAK